jgi:hypothetical protein
LELDESGASREAPPSRGEETTSERPGPA